MTPRTSKVDQVFWRNLYNLEFEQIFLLNNSS